MSGEVNIEKLIANISPILDRKQEYVFISQAGAYGDFTHLGPIASFMEEEGLTLIIPKHIAEMNGVPFDGSFRKITLQVHSSLQAVGLTAAVSQALKAHQISANVIAGYFHDHLFVQSHHAERALSCLETLSDSYHQ